MNQSVLGLYYEDLVVGETIKHSLSKTIFESDNNFFSLLTMNHHPVHTNLDYAQQNQHGKILVVGTLVFSLAVGMTVPEISIMIYFRLSRNPYEVRTKMRRCIILQGCLKQITLTGWKIFRWSRLPS